MNTYTCPQGHILYSDTVNEDGYCRACLEARIAAAEAELTRRLARDLAIVELRERGMSLRSIATVLGCSHEYVRQILRVNSP